MNIWYKEYPSLKENVLRLRSVFRDRCVVLGVEPSKVLDEFNREFLARAVHESNWQEGLELGVGKTQELANLAFDEIEDIVGPHLDMNKILRFHRSAVIRMKRSGATEQEIGAYNLARAYHSINWVANELAGRQTLSLAHALRGLRSLFEKNEINVPQENREQIERGFRIINELEADTEPLKMPMTIPPRSQGEYVSELLKLDFEHLLHPMKTAYIHFFHRIIMMGIMPASNLGVFRKKPVHVGNFHLYFPAPTAIPHLMKEFCEKFPTILPNSVKCDSIVEAANASHRFVSIHPYMDGNGRVSRVIMNLVLWGHFPPVYLKADKKG